jgi:hypothetical protein
MSKKIKKPLAVRIAILAITISLSVGAGVYICKLMGDLLYANTTISSSHLSCNVRIVQLEDDKYLLQIQIGKNKWRDYDVYDTESEIMNVITIIAAMENISMSVSTNTTSTQKNK